MDVWFTVWGLLNRLGAFSIYILDSSLLLKRAPLKRAHRVENSTTYRADDLCVNLVCKYFCWLLGDPHFFFGRSLPFLTLSIMLKNKKNLCVGSFHYFSFTNKKEANLYMDTGVRDLEVVFFKANSS